MIERWRSRLGTSVAVAVLGLAWAGPAVGQEPAETMEAGSRAEVAEAAAGILEENYVDPSLGRRMAERLRQGAARDAWAEAGDPASFARALTAELNEIARDLHLSVVPPGREEAPGPRRTVRRTGPAAGETDDGAPGRRIARRSPGGLSAERPAARAPRRGPVERSRDLPSSYRIPPDASPEMRERLMASLAERVAEERRENHYFRAAEVLPGNVGYLDLDRFPLMPDAAPAADAAMLFLAEVDAFVLDLRGNPGGGEGMNQYLGSFFFADSVHLYSRYYRPGDETVEYWTRPGLLPLRLPEVPLFVLVDGRSGSAAENMAFNLQRTGRATVVGDTTAGAGHSSTRADLPAGFSMVVPIARVYDPRTGEGFEGTGVAPDVAVDPSEALAAAHRLAIEALVDRSDDPARAAELERAGILYTARSAPPLPPDALEAYAGSYGARRVWVEGGRLRLRRTDVSDAPELVLLRVGPDRFVLDAMPDVRVEFERGEDGGVRSVRVLGPTGRWETSARE